MFWSEDCLRTKLLNYIRQGKVEKAQAVLDEFSALEWSMEPSHGWTVVHEAVANNQLEILKAILAKDARLLNFADGNGWTPLTIAKQLGHKEIIKVLTARGASDIGFTLQEWAKLEEGMEKASTAPPTPVSSSEMRQKLPM